MCTRMTKLFSGIFDIKSKTSKVRGKGSYQRDGVCEELADFLCYSAERLKNPKTRLRRELNRVFLTNRIIFQEQIKDIVDRFLTSLTEGHTKKEGSAKAPMPPLFYCKCGSFLYSPVTLPCGHTLCKDCFDASSSCKYCGTAVDNSCSPNHFLIDLLSVWFKEEYRLCRTKKDSKSFINDQEYDKALERINSVLKERPNDHTALIIRSEIRSKLGQHKEASADAELSCKLNYNCGKSHFRRGLCYLNIGKLNDAIDAFQVCLEVEPDDIQLSNLVITNIDRILSSSSEKFEYSCQERTRSASNSSNSSDESSPPRKAQFLSHSRNNSSVSGESSKTRRKSRKSKLKNCKNSEESFQQKEVILQKNGVPIDLIKDDDVECKLCFEILIQPVTTKCGHVFCKRCLLRTLDHNSVCPICRCNLSNFSRKASSTTFIIEQILDTYYGEQYQERKSTYEHKLKELTKIGTDENVEVPVFMCAVAFPYVQCPLHIFEPKYRLMIRDCLESGSQKFGMCVPTGDEMSDIGTICEITKWQGLPDGRFIIHIVAKQRFLVQETNVKESLTYAKVKYFVDEPEEFTEEQSNSSKLAYNQLASYISTLSTAEKDCIFNALGILPNYSEEHEKYEHGVPWIWWGLSALPLNLNAKLVLLRCKCASERILSLQRFLQFLNKLQPLDESRSSAAEAGFNI